MRFWRTPCAELPPLSALPPNVREQVRGVRAEPDKPSLDEAQFYSICPDCGQAIDERSLYQVLHHNEFEHNQLSEAELTNLSR
jgi:hypothetical protein